MNAGSRIPPDRLSVAALSRIDRCCDEFEAIWENGQSPSIAEFLQRSHTDDVGLGERRALLLELIKIDLEYRWRDDDGQVSAESWLLEDYAERFSEFGPVRAAPLELIQLEYVCRQQRGASPELTEYRRRFDHPGERLEASLLAAVLEVAPFLVKVYCDQRLAFSMAMTGTLELGRQRSDEPGPFHRPRDAGNGRLIIAPLEDRSVSRRHLLVEPRPPSAARITNVTQRAIISVEAGDALQPGQERDMDLPVLLILGGVAIRIARTTD